MDEDASPLSINLADHASDIETPDNALAFTLTQSPAAAQGTTNLTDSNLTFTPKPNFNGVVEMKYSATDDGDNGAAPKATEGTISITVNPVNDAPTAGAVNETVLEDTPKNINLLAQSADIDGDDLEVIIVSQPGKGAATVNANGTVRYAPRANLNGPDSFTYKVSDGELESAAATVGISITPVNDAPVARNDASRTLINRAVNINVLANDADPDGDRLSSAIVSQPSRGLVIRNANNTIRYIPPRNFVGRATFTYRASDGNGGSDTATVRITVARR